MRGELLHGAVAGAAGTTALNAVTYLDMALRGRPASQTPQQSVDQLAKTVHIDLGEGEQASNRRSGVGSLLSIATGVGVGVGIIYGLLRERHLGSLATETILMGLSAMAAGNVPMTAMGITDRRWWSVADWAADVVPHLMYGLVGAVTLARLTRSH